MEDWRDVRGNPGYEVSSSGEVKNIKTGKILKPGRHRQGYSMVHLSDQNVVHGKTVHRLVAEAFIPNPEQKPQVNHIDGNKSNNQVSNLEWNTGSENTVHAYRTGLFDGRPKVSVKIVETGEVFESVQRCAETIGGNKGNISSCMHGRLDSYKGLHFERGD